jgi:hypothetical protein
MLKITIPGRDMFNEETNEFIHTNEHTIQLEHSLVSVSKWESKWNKPFLSKEPKSIDETIDYIRCMTITQNIDPVVYNGLTTENIEMINKYIDAPMTATTFSRNRGPMNNEIVTSELIYYWMTALNIPMECQKWHLNRLLTLIRVCNVKSSPDKKMSKREIMQRNSALNAARRARLNSKG